RSNFVHLKKSSFQIIPTNVQHCTWLGFFLPPAAREFRQEKSPGRVGERTRKKRFSFHLQILTLRSSSIKSENALGSVQPCAPPVAEMLVPHLTCAADGVMIGIF
ncbi:MAG: hypothetical protein KHW91_09415, partial [Clostridiales bacterium]|nr:hypothetical protein [Clostridiales bacterium]